MSDSSDQDFVESSDEDTPLPSPVIPVAPKANKRPPRSKNLQSKLKENMDGIEELKFDPNSESSTLIVPASWNLMHCILFLQRFGALKQGNTTVSKL
jgi:hypothetical protein